MKLSESLSLQQILESAVVVCWTDLMRGAPKGLIHIEYDLAPEGTLNRLQIWSCLDRGHWLLVCEYWMSASKLHLTGVHFENGYKSENLTHILESVMQHQTAFSLPVDRRRQGLLQISTPTQQEIATGSTLVSQALQQFNSVFDQPLAA